MPSGNRLLKVNTINAVALACLTPEQRAEIRAKGLKEARHSDPAVIALQVELQVSKHAVATVARYQDDEIEVFEVAEEVTGDEGRIEPAQIEDYQTFLYEPSRPPSQGGNTSALHVHTIWVQGQKYSFFARGSLQWVYKADRVSFSYRTTEAGYRNIIKQTLATLDKDARGVCRHGPSPPQLCLEGAGIACR